MWIELASAAAWAGSCCAGTTTALPTRVGECEDVAAAVMVGADHVLARWDGKARLASARPSERVASSAVGLGWRWSRQAQLQLVVPARWTWRRSGDTRDAGGGVGDVYVGLVLDPFEEGTRMPAAVLSAGLRLPTGRDWTESWSPLLADVTGQPGVAVRAGAALERQLGTSPWSVGVDLDAGPGAPVALALYGAAGRAIGSEWSVSAGVRHVATFAGQGTNRTTVSAWAVRGQRLAWRAWGGLAVDVPLPGLGRNQTAAASASLGLAWIH